MLRDNLLTYLLGYQINDDKSKHVEGTATVSWSAKKTKIVLHFLEKQKRFQCYRKT